MTDPVVLVGGILTDAGTYFLLVERDDAEDDESVVCAGRRDESTIPVRELTDLEEIQSLIALVSPWTKRGEAASLTAEGDVMFLAPDSADTEIVPGAGYRNDGAKQLGRMTGFAQIDDRLIAMGYGGQVYIRRHGSDWSDDSVPVGTSSAEAIPAFNDVALGGDGTTLAFGGSDITSLVETDEIDAANEAGDADLLAELILAGTRPDLMSIRLYYGSWIPADLGAEEGAVARILPAANRTFLVFTNTGVVFRTFDFTAFEEVFRRDTPESFDDIKLYGAEPLLLCGNTLLFYRHDELVPFDPPLPADKGFCLSFWPAGDSIAAVFPDHIQLYENGGWTRLIPILI